jgi:hypothetical protein
MESTTELPSKKVKKSVEMVGRLDSKKLKVEISELTNPTKANKIEKPKIKSGAKVSSLPVSARGTAVDQPVPVTKTAAQIKKV